MSYTKQDWASKTVVTKSGLINMDNQIEANEQSASTNTTAITNITTGTTVVGKATADANGNNIASTYLPKTGEGASGTWGIGISGNAASATKLATPRNINGIAFDGSSDIDTPNAKLYSITNVGDNHTYFIIPLHSLDNTDTSADFYFSGEIVLKRSNIMSSRYKKISILSGKNYNESYPRFNLQYVKDDFDISVVRYLKNGVYWCGLYVKVSGASYNSDFSNYFIGETNTGWANNVIEAIKVYNSNTATVLDQEVYSSIEELSPTTYGLNYKFSGDCEFTGEIVAKSILASKQTDPYGGGIVDLGKPTNSSLSGNARIQLVGTQVQVREIGGNERGVSLELTECENSTGSKLLHTGISAPVVISATAPSDTSAVWIS